MNIRAAIIPALMLPLSLLIACAPPSSPSPAATQTTTSTPSTLTLSVLVGIGQSMNQGFLSARVYGADKKPLDGIEVRLETTAGVIVTPSLTDFGGLAQSTVVATEPVTVTARVGQISASILVPLQPYFGVVTPPSTPPALPPVFVPPVIPTPPATHVTLPPFYAYLSAWTLSTDSCCGGADDKHLPLASPVRFHYQTVPADVIVTRCEWDFFDGTISSVCGDLTRSYTSRGIKNTQLWLTSSDGRRAPALVQVQMEQ